MYFLAPAEISFDRQVDFFNLNPFSMTSFQRWFIALGLALGCVALSPAAETEANAIPIGGPAKPAPEAKEADQSPKEEASTTKHVVKIGGVDIPYTATAGTLLIRKDGDPVASVFYVAYTRDGVNDLRRRPVTFFYNGGPGSSTIWLHMGS